MAPRPLKQVVPGIVAYATGPEALRHQPELAAIAMNVVSQWAVNEVRMARILVELLGAQSRPVVAMHSALTSTQAQTAALRAVAKTMVSAERWPIFDAALLVVKKLAKERNRIAHWIFGYSEQVPDAFLLINPADFIDGEVEYHEGIAKGANVMDMTLRKEGAFIYDKIEFERVYMDAVLAQSIIIRLTFLCSPSQLASLAYDQLSNEPLIRSVLDRGQRSQPTKTE